MGWSIGYDNNWKRDIGYGVPAKCDYPGCEEIIDRGLSYVCGTDPYGGEEGCGLYFCHKHLYFNHKGISLCERCMKKKEPFEPKPDIEEWTNFKMTDPSWEEWRKSNNIKEKDIKVIYIAGPYTADTKEQKQINLNEAEKLAKSLVLLGYSCIIPHKLTAFWDYDENFIDWKESDWLDRCCFPILKKCDALILTEGWQKSSGCLKEIEFCTNNSIPVYKSIRQLLKHINKEAY